MHLWLCALRRYVERRNKTPTAHGSDQSKIGSDQSNTAHTFLVASVQKMARFDPAPKTFGTQTQLHLGPFHVPIPQRRIEKIPPGPTQGQTKTPLRVQPLSFPS